MAKKLPFNKENYQKMLDKRLKSGPQSPPQQILQRLIQKGKNVNRI